MARNKGRLALSRPNTLCWHGTCSLKACKSSQIFLSNLVGRFVLQLHPVSLGTSADMALSNATLYAVGWTRHTYTLETNCLLSTMRSHQKCTTMLCGGYACACSKKAVWQTLCCACHLQQCPTPVYKAAGAQAILQPQLHPHHFHCCSSEYCHCH